jgi:hypothetical protein
MKKAFKFMTENCDKLAFLGGVIALMIVSQVKWF